MDDISFFKQLKQRPLLFIKEAWSLIPQPVKPEYKDEVEIFVKNGLWDRIEAKHFEIYQKGNITWQQWLALLAVERSLIGQAPKKISIVSGHGTGKSTVFSWLILWYLFCFKDAQIGITAPTSDQLNTVLWKEIKVWLDRMPPRLAEKYDWQETSLNWKESPNTQFARARTARKENTEALAGLHGDYVFIGADEGSGVDDAIYRSAEGSLTGPNTLVILISNGTRNLGYFYDTHHSDKANWQTLCFSSEDSPIVEKDYVSRMEQKYGRESDEFKIRVLGKFPASEQSDEQGYIPLITDTQIKQLPEFVPFAGRKKMGVDPSGEGDDQTIILVRDDFMAKVVHKESTSNSKGIARKVYDIAKELEINSKDITIDNFGVGANVSAELLLIDHQFHVNAVNWADKPRDEETYLNQRAEAHFRGRNWLLRGGSIVGDEIKRDLVALRYKNNLNGKKSIMEKHKIKQLLGRSPDRSDALFLTFVDDTSMDIYVSGVVETSHQPTELDRFSAI